MEEGRRPSGVAVYHSMGEKGIPWLRGMAGGMGVKGH